MATMDESSTNWFQEYINPGLFQMSAIRNEVHSQTTRFQSVKVLDTIPYGRCLVLDGKTQSADNNFSLLST